MKWRNMKWISALIATTMIMPVFNEIPVYALGEKEIVSNWKDIGRYIEYPVGKLQIAADSTQPGYGTNLMLDKNINTKWEKQWGSSSEGTILTINLNEIEYVTGFMHTSRVDNNIGGTLEEYKVFVSRDGVNYEEAPVLEGNLNQRLGTTYIYFEQPMWAKSIKIEGKVAAIAELSLGYIPKTEADYEMLVSEAEELLEHVRVNEGLDAGAWLKGTYEIYKDRLQQIKNEVSEKVIQNKQLTECITDLHYSKMVHSKEIQNIYNLARTMLRAAVVGGLPLQYEMEETEKFRNLIEESEPIATANIVKHGELLRAKEKLEEGIKWFEQAAIKPDIRVIGANIQQGKVEDIMDGVTATRLQVTGGGNIVTPDNDNHYIELDYKQKVQFEEINFYSWWATQQAPNRIKVQYKDGEEWKWVDGGKTYALPWKTYQGQSEEQIIKFDQAVKGSALRIHVDGAGSHYYGVDELKVGIGVAKEDIRVVLDTEEMTLEEGGNYTLTATVLPSYATNKNVVWESSHPQYVSVDPKGRVSALAVPKEVESVTITATTEYGEKQDTCVVRVTPKVVDEKEREKAQIRIDNAKKLASASKEIDYTLEEIRAFEQKITEIEAQFKEVQELGEFNKLGQKLKELVEAYERQSNRIERETRKLIDRITGVGSEENFIIEVIEKDQVEGQDVYEVDFDEVNQKVILRGNNAVSLATAYNYYLKYYVYLDFPYTGAYELELPSTLPTVEESVRIVFPYEYRHYFNVNCEYKYTADLYSMEEWQRKLDWMAMNGFNMYLLEAPVDVVWYKAADQIGLSEEAKKELRKSGNYQYWGDYEISEAAYQKQMDKLNEVAKMSLDLGIEPEVRPFSGNIGFMFPNNRNDYYNKSVYKPEFTVDLPESELLDGLRVYTGARWFNLPQGLYVSPQIGEDNPMLEADMKERFDKIAEIYYETTMELLGFNEYGKVPKFAYGDVVGEQGFMVQHPAFPKEVLTDLEAQLLKVNPDAIWIQSSWRYYSWVNEVFTPGHIIWIDLEAEGGPKWNSSNEFDETPWMWSMLNNFGGNSGMSGGFDTIAQEVLSSNQKANHMKGVAISPEGGDTDPALYNLMAEMTWRSEKIDMDQWLKDYAKRRYGKENYEMATKELDKVWSGLYQTVYKQFVTQGPSQTLVAAHPRMSGAKARTWGTNWKPYHTKDLIEIWENLIVASMKMEEPNEQLLYDIADLTRQILADMSGDVYEKIAPAYQSKDKEEALKYADMMVEICKDMDEILSTRKEFLLGTRLEASKNRGVTEQDKSYFDKLERTFLTYWVLDDYNLGSGLMDYCNKHLAGLMTDYYGMRWQVFRDELDNALSNNQSFNQGKIEQEIKTNVLNWAEAGNTYASDEQGDTLAVAERLYDKYYPQMKALYNLSEQAGDKGKLEELYNTHKDKEKGEYTTESWEYFVKVLENALEVLENETVQSQVVIQRTIKELEEGIDGLTLRMEGYTIKVPETVKAGKGFKVVLTLNDTEQPIYAQDLMITYDENLVEFIAVTDQEDTVVVKSDNQENAVRLLLAHKEGITKEYSLEIEFLAKDQNVIQESIIGLTQSEWGVVEAGTSTVIKVPNVEEKISIVPQEEGVDKEQLEQMIKQAQQLVEEAQIGSGVGEYPLEAKQALEAVITQANEVVNSSQDQSEVNEMVLELREAMETFKASQIQGAKEDINQDGQVDVADLAMVSYYYAKTSTDPDWENIKKVDLDGNGSIGIEDLSWVASKILSK